MCGSVCPLPQAQSTLVFWRCEESGKVHSSQSGFLPNHNTYELILRLTEHAWESRLRNSVLHALLVDINKAYDSEWHNGLRYKLREQLGIRGRLYFWIDDFLRDRAGRAVLNGKKSRFHKINVGVPQGACISPLLWLVYVNDLPALIEDLVQIGIFADDVAIWPKPVGCAPADIDKAKQQLQDATDKMDEWATKWRLLLSPKKTQYIQLRHPNKTKYDKSPITLKGNAIEPNPTSSTWG